MGNPPDLKRIVKDDYPPQYQDLVDRLGFGLNSFMEQVIALFTNNIDFTNLAQQKVTITIKTDSTGTPIGNNAFKTTLVNKVTGIVTLSGTITSSTNQFVTNYPFITFTQNSSIITINNISNLSPNTTYNFLLLLVS